MTVFVDNANLPHRGQLWSHLVAEEPEELHRAAEALGLSRTAAQDRGRTLHYDLPAAWRRRAIESGLAEPISWRELIARRQTFARGTASAARGLPGSDAAPGARRADPGGVTTERL
jgi:hypothetical protein